MNNLDWNLILRALSHRIEQLKTSIEMYNHNPDQHIHDLEVANHELEICKKEYRQVLIAQQQSNKLTPEEKYYSDLRKYYNGLIKNILGDNYYTVSCDVANSDKEAYDDMLNTIKTMQMDLVVYKQLFYFLIVLFVGISIWSLLK